MGIQSVFDRRALRNRLVDRLGGPRRIAEETQSYVLEIDWQKTGKAWPTARRVWEGYGPEASHHLLLQDDAWPCNNFWSVVRRVISAAPEAILVLCTPMQGKPPDGHHFIRATHMTGQAIVFPTALLDHFLCWERDMFRPAFPHSDVRVEFYAKTFGRDLLATVPSIVDHRDDGWSALGNPPFKVFRYIEEIDERAKWVVPEDMVEQGFWGLSYDMAWWLFERGYLGDTAPPRIHGPQREMWLAKRLAAGRGMER